MNILDYLKERWILLVFLSSAFLFALAVYKLDHNFSIRDSNAGYILMGWSILFIVFVAADFCTVNSRAGKFRMFCRLNGSTDESEVFFYPTDREKAKLVRELAVEYEKYRSEIETKSAEEMEYITKWLHDAKVPIAAAKLILETQEDKIPGHIYKNTLF